MNDRIAGVDQGEQALTVTWALGHVSVFHYIWLRDNCRTSIHTASGQRLTNPAEFHGRTRPEAVRVEDGQYLEITWAADGHVSRFDAGWLAAHCYTKEPRPSLPSRILWDASTPGRLPEADYEDVVANRDALKRWLALFRDHGIVMLRGVPTRPQAVLEVGRLASSVWRSHWGESFDVMATDDPLFIGFTNAPLPSHVDDGFCQPVPPVLLLHCLVNDAEGGESTVVDGFKLVSILKAEDPKALELLSSWPMQYFFRNKDFHFEVEAPLIRLDVLGNPEQIRFSNQSMKPFRLPVDIMEAYYDAYCKFSRLAESDALQVRYRFQVGDCVMIDNHRILHGRRGFSAGGKRHLQSCFVARDALLSRLSMLDS